jgi:hypothetical protein
MPFAWKMLTNLNYLLNSDINSISVIIPDYLLYKKSLQTIKYKQ